MDHRSGVFEIEDDQGCNYDYVDVYSGTDISGYHYGKFCGNTVCMKNGEIFVVKRFIREVRGMK